ncbi:MAG: hypothetical protein RLZZ387_223 [Chloroflexota bacterium]|jgi:hypothetical protein
MRLRSIWVVFGLLMAATLALAPFGTAAAKDKVTNPFANIPVQGSGPSKESFKGQFTVTSFVEENAKLYAVGNLAGTYKDSSGKTKGISLSGVKWEIESINGVDPSPSAAAAPMFSAMQAGCEILDLQLGPLDLTLLGLNIFLDEVNLEITAIPGAGLLGDLLCAVNNLLNPLGTLTQFIQALTNLLNFFNGL